MLWRILPIARQEFRHVQFWGCGFGLRPRQRVLERNLTQIEKILLGLSDGADVPEPVSRDDLPARIAEGSVTINDVRPADDCVLGHIPGAKNVALHELERIARDLQPGAEIITYCRDPYCIDAHQTVTILRKRGLNTRRLEGGLPEWREEGRRVATSGLGLTRSKRYQRRSETIESRLALWTTLYLQQHRDDRSK